MCIAYTGFHSMIRSFTSRFRYLIKSPLPFNTELTMPC